MISDSEFKEALEQFTDDMQDFHKNPKQEHSGSFAIKGRYVPAFNLLKKLFKSMQASALNNGETFGSCEEYVMSVGIETVIKEVLSTIQESPEKTIETLLEKVTPVGRA